ncbi:MAG: hypothetical protein L7S55_03470 [Luminiphilus sp.]|nr:hypothetical protein [Luminiphilus sp.]
MNDQAAGGNLSHDRLKDRQILFSWRQFWISFIYENLPPVFISPFAALLFERSLPRTWSVCQHRNLMVLSTRYNPWGFILYSWLIVYPASWLITAGALTALFAPEALLGGIDPMQMLCAYAFLLTRRLIVAVKYGYFDAADFTALSHPAPEWSFEKSSEKLIAVGWGKPKQFPGLIRSELELAEQGAGIALDEIQISADSGTPATLKDVTLTILDEAYSRELPKSTNGIIVMSVLSILVSFLMTKWQSGAPLIGDTVQMQLVNLGTYTAILSGMGIMGFGLICALDFSRRQRALEILDSGLFDSLSSSAGQQEVGARFDPRSPHDLRCWVSARTVIRKFGERYYMRVQTYTSILLCFSFLCVGFLNFLAWTGTPHQLSSVVLLAATIAVIATIGTFAMYRAIRLHTQSLESRSQLLEQLLNEEIVMAERDKEQGDPTSASTSLCTTLLRQIDTNLNFSEIVLNPTTVLGYKADTDLISSILGLLVTGCLLAFQGFAGGGFTYSSAGWFIQ